MKHKSRFLNSSLFKISFPVILITGCLGATDTQTLQHMFDKKYTTNKISKKLFMKQISGLNNEEQDMFLLGRSFFTVPWVEAPSATTARDGLGPLFNSNTCVNCHPNNGIGSIYNKNGNISRDYVTRLSIPSNGSDKHNEMLKYSGFIQEPTYGGQISINGVYGVKYEAKPLIKYEDILFTYPDGHKVVLKKPLQGVDNQLKDLQYGKMHKNVILTNRLAPALVGLGLLEQLSDAQILSNEDINDCDNDGISGKANIVYSALHKDYRVGRYTYKASSPSVIHQSGAAANNDMSLTNPIFQNENCTEAQTDCLAAPRGDKRRGDTGFDLPMHRLQAVAFYISNLKIPKSIVTQKKGERLFAKISCTKCHTPSFKLASGYEIKPFTDLLLHDMGEGLSDGRVEFRALATEWRTAPLWSKGKYINAGKKSIELLHDGRAKTIEEAILWHGGEASEIKNNFINLSQTQRQQIIKYIKEL